MKLVTPMTLPQFIDIWGSLPLNQPEGVAHALLLPILRPEINGRAFFVAGYQIVGLEDKLHETQSLWMGKQLSKRCGWGTAETNPISRERRMIGFSGRLEMRGWYRGPEGSVCQTQGIRITDQGIKESRNLSIIVSLKKFLKIKAIDRSII